MAKSPAATAILVVSGTLRCGSATKFEDSESYALAKGDRLQFGPRSGRSLSPAKFIPLSQPFSNNSSATELMCTPTAAQRALEPLLTGNHEI
jgi:hypothetical protein